MNDRALVLRLHRGARLLDAMLDDVQLASGPPLGAHIASHSAASNTSVQRYSASWRSRLSTRGAAVVGSLCIAVSLGFHSHAGSAAAAVAVRTERFTVTPTLTAPPVSVTRPLPTVAARLELPQRRNETAVGTTAPSS